MMASTFLTDAEVTEICEPLKTAAAQRRHLTRLGLHVAQKPNGRALVTRSEVERVLGAGRFGGQDPKPTAQPNTAALLSLFQGGKRGTQAKGR